MAARLPLPNVAQARARAAQAEQQRVEFERPDPDRGARNVDRGGLRRIADDDLIALPTLYRTAASSLSVARETSLDAATLAYLEALVQRAWFQVYGPRMGFVRWLRDFLFGGWSRAVRELWLDISIALFVMVAAMTAASMSVGCSTSRRRA